MGRAASADRPMGVPCPDCGGLFDDIDGPTHAYLGASSGCWAAFGDLTQRELDLGIAGPERLSVQAYTVQHPGDEGRRQAQSVGVHLMVLACVLERAMPVAATVALMPRWLAGSPTFPWLRPPAGRGGITVADVLGTPASDGLPSRSGHELAVRRWADAVWAAWSAEHERIARWVDRGRPD